MNLLTDRLKYEASIDRPKIKGPNGSKIIVWTTVNVELWNIIRPMPRNALPPPMGNQLLPNVPNWSWHEYGNRVGFWRHLNALQSRDIRATLAINGHVCSKYPRIAEAALEAGWEFMGHGYEQQPQHSLDNEDAEIAAAVEEIKTFTGKQPIGWESPGLTETENTLDLLKKNATAKFDESIDISMKINLKQSKGGDFNLRTVFNLPNGSRIISGRLAHDALNSSTTLSVGYAAHTNAAGTSVSLSAAAYKAAGSSASATAANVANTIALGENSIVDANKDGLPVSVTLGLSLIHI